MIAWWRFIRWLVAVWCVFACQRCAQSTRRFREVCAACLSCSRRQVFTFILNTIFFLLKFQRNAWLPMWEWVFCRNLFDYIIKCRDYMTDRQYMNFEKSVINTNEWEMQHFILHNRRAWSVRSGADPWIFVRFACRVEQCTFNDVYNCQINKQKFQFICMATNRYVLLSRMWSGNCDIYLYNLIIIILIGMRL